ncbi:MAG: threonylcarbamoyl-AMP synthase [Ectothiorhodospiraceae bacterium]|nr:threonylcarbamoyl-AMP synthase [Ectothiorhodospiraceae bacterium]
MRHYKKPSVSNIPSHLVSIHWKLKQVANVVHQGGVIAYPTEAVYGLGCDPLNALAVSRLLALKHRSIHKGLILIASRLEQLHPFIAPLDANSLSLLHETWPGPFTWLLPARENTPRWLRGTHSSIAVRVTAHPLASALCESTGHALVSTSANPSGLPPARRALKVRQYFPEQIDAILTGAVGTASNPSPIRDLATKKLIRPTRS